MSGSFAFLINQEVSSEKPENKQADLVKQIWLKRFSGQYPACEFQFLHSLFSDLLSKELARGIMELWYCTTEEGVLQP